MADPVGYLIKRLRLVLRNHFDAALAPYGLTAASYEALFLLSTHGPASASDLARLAGTAVQTMHRQVSSMTEQGLLTPLDGPGRAVRMVPSTRAVDLFTKARADVDAIEHRMLTGLGPDDVEALRNLLLRCERNLA